MIFYTKEKNMNGKYIQRVIEQASLEVTLEICVQEVLGWTVATLTEIIVVYLGECRYGTSIRPRELCFKSLSNSSAILPFAAM
jgi:hypothetical protein